MTANSKIKVWYDGAHPASVEEIELLKAKDQAEDKEGQRLQIVDASGSDFKAEGEVTADAVRKNILARDASGKVTKGVEALETIYNAIGLGNYFRFTRKPGLESGRKFEPAAPELKKAA